MKCLYCKRWQEANPKLITSQMDSKNKPVTLRFCPKANDRVASNHPACLEIVVAKYFYCHHFQERVPVLLCLARQGLLKKSPKFVPQKCRSFTCHQSKEVRELTRGRNLSMEHGYVKRVEVQP